MEVEPGIYDFRLENDSSMVVSGPSKSGKSTFVKNLIQHRDRMFRKPIQKMYWFYGVAGDHHQDLESLGVHLKEGAPTREDFDRLAAGDLIILDDLQEEVKGDEEVTNLFLKGCHHKGFFAVTITQYLYGDQQQRKRTNNAHYFTLFNNPRNHRQLSNFLHTMFSKGQSKLVQNLLGEIQKSKYGYLFIDFTPECDPALRFRTNIFKPELVIFKLDEHGHHGKMDLSRVTIGGQQGGGGPQKQQPDAMQRMMKTAEEDRNVRQMMNPMQQHVESIARRIIQNSEHLTPSQMRHRTRRLIAFDRIRRLYMGIENKPPPIPMRHQPDIPPRISMAEAKKMSGPSVRMASPSTPKIFKGTRSRAGKAVASKGVKGSLKEESIPERAIKRRRQSLPWGLEE